MSSSMDINNKGKCILILGKSPTQVWDDNMLKVEARCLISFLRSNRTFCLNLHYNGSNRFLFVNDAKVY